MNPDHFKKDVYFIQHKGYVGNCLLFWGPNRSGYTCNLLNAGEYTKEEAEEICKSRPKEDIPHLASKILAKAQSHATET